MQATRPRAIVDLIHSAENFRIELGSEGNLPQPRKCERCGYICSQSVCKACQLLEGLNKGLPSMGISRPGQVKSRTATKLAAEKLRALTLSADQAAVDHSSDADKVSCQCAGGGSVAVARISCSESEQCMAPGKRGTPEMGSNGCGSADSCLVTAAVGSNGKDHNAPDRCSQDELQLPQQSISAGQSSCGACKCDSVSAHQKGALCVSGSDWTLAGNLAGGEPKLVQAPDQLACHSWSPMANVDGYVVSQQPLRVHGKLYESNLRQVDAHPSARRPIRTDFETTW